MVSLLEVILIVTNAGTLILLGMSIRSTKRWIKAYSEAGWAMARYASKQEAAKIRNENGGW